VSLPLCCRFDECGDGASKLQNFIRAEVVLLCDFRRNSLLPYYLATHDGVADLMLMIDSFKAMISSASDLTDFDVLPRDLQCDGERGNETF